MENVISKTLLVPLYFRALDAQKEESVLNDTKALELIKNFEFDTKTLDKAKFSQVGTMARAKFFDDRAREFIKNNPNPIIVNMATGLDTRTFRIYDEKVKFFDIDLPEVIEIRKRYIKDKSTVLCADAFEKDYIEELLKYKDAQFCFIFEGFFCYFEKEKIEIILNNIANNFHGSILGDFNFGDFWEKNQEKHDAMKNNPAKFKTSFQTLEELLNTNKKIKVKESKFFYDKDFSKILGWRRYLMLILPKKMKMSRLLELEF